MTKTENATAQIKTPKTLSPYTVNIQNYILIGKFQSIRN